MRRRTGLASAVALVAVLAIALVVVLTGGGDDASGGGQRVKLRWAAKPLVFTPERLPNDRTMTGRVVNDSLRKIRVRAKKLHVVDADGRRLDTSGLFLSTYSHALYPPTQRPPGVENSTQARLAGEYVDLQPSQKAPLTVSWRMKPGLRAPLRLSYDGGFLPIGGGSR